MCIYNVFLFIIFFIFNRAIGMLWIIIAHVYFFSFGSIDNMQLAMNFADLLIVQPMLNAAINVDTFFALGYVSLCKIL